MVRRLPFLILCFGFLCCRVYKPCSRLDLPPAVVLALETLAACPKSSSCLYLTCRRPLVAAHLLQCTASLDKRPTDSSPGMASSSAQKATIYPRRFWRDNRGFRTFARSGIRRS